MRLGSGWEHVASSMVLRHRSPDLGIRHIIAPTAPRPRPLVPLCPSHRAPLSPHLFFFVVFFLTFVLRQGAPLRSFQNNRSTTGVPSTRRRLPSNRHCLPPNRRQLPPEHDGVYVFLFFCSN